VSIEGSPNSTQHLAIGNDLDRMYWVAGEREVCCVASGAPSAPIGLVFNRIAGSNAVVAATALYFLANATELLGDTSRTKVRKLASHPKHEGSSRKALLR
jgi:hypothetical protein